jgi:hypothetical protein
MGCLFSKIFIPIECKLLGRPHGSERKFAEGEFLMQT